MVRLTVVLSTSARSTRRMIAALRSVMMPARLERGCLSCYVWPDPDGTVHYEEEWATEGHIRQRVRSDSFTALLGVMDATVELAV